MRITLEYLVVESAAERISMPELDQIIETYQHAQNHFLANDNPSLLAECDPLVHDVLIKYNNND